MRPRRSIYGPRGLLHFTHKGFYDFDVLVDNAVVDNFGHPFETIDEAIGDLFPRRTMLIALPSKRLHKWREMMLMSIKSKTLP